MLLLPPLLPVISDAMQISYTQLGFGITMFSLMTGLAQAPMGVLVARLGAGWVLITGLAIESLAFSLVGVWPVYGAFVFLMGVAGLGNAVYHPADYAIHLDPWWNPAVEDQASDRAHRLGQQRPVTIVRMVTTGTIEEQIQVLHGSKRELADSVLAGADSPSFDADTMMRLLRGDAG